MLDDRLKGLKWGTGQASFTADIREAKEGDASGCTKCGSPLKASDGIEVGHCFYLGQKYSEALGARFAPTGGGPQEACEMGCYGIGVTRLIGAVAEASHDGDGLLWPDALAPYRAAVLVLDMKNEADLAEGRRIAALLADGHGGLPGIAGDVCLDDRSDSAGRKLKDATLIGFPYTIVVGKAFRKEGNVELQFRRTGERTFGKPADAVARVLGAAAGK